MKILCTALLCLLLTNTNAQTNLLKKKYKKVRVTDVYLQSLLGSNPKAQATITDFKKMVPQSVLLNNNYTGYTQNSGLYYQGDGSFSPSIGLQLGRKANRSLRLGANFSFGNGINLYYSKVDKYRIDTLTSSQTGAQTFMDSSVTNSLHMNYNYKTVGFDAAMLFRTAPKTKWTIYGGIGVNIGMALNSDVNITKSVGSGNSYNFGNFYNSYFISNSTSEYFDAPNNKAHTASVYLPFGIDYKLSKKSEFFKRLHLFFEARPSLTYISIDNISSKTDFTNMAGFGLRVNWK
jgi:hypothetical protein